MKSTIKYKDNNPIHAVTEHLKILQENEEEDNNNNNYNNYNSYAVKYEMYKRPLSQSSNNNPQQRNHGFTNKGDQNPKHMPDHLASKFVDDILNSKFSEWDYAFYI